MKFLLPCGCNCLLTGLSCEPLSSTGDFFAPNGSCDASPVDDDCLSGVSVATCTLSSIVADITPSAFQTTPLACAGAAAADATSTQRMSAPTGVPCIRPREAWVRWVTGLWRTTAWSQQLPR